VIDAAVDDIDGGSQRGGRSTAAVGAAAVDAKSTASIGAVVDHINGGGRRSGR